MRRISSRACAPARGLQKRWSTPQPIFGLKAASSLGGLPSVMVGSLWTVHASRDAGAPRALGTRPPSRTPGALEAPPVFSRILTLDYSIQLESRVAQALVTPRRLDQ